MKNRYAALIVYAPQTLALILALTLLIEQWREVYIAMAERALAERRDVWHAGLGFVGLVWLNAVIYSWNWTNTDRRVDEIYPEHARLTVDRELKDWRDVKPLGTAVIIPAAVGLGMWLAAAWCGNVLTSLGQGADDDLTNRVALARLTLLVALPLVVLGMLLPLFLLAGTRFLHRGVDLSRWAVMLAVIGVPLALEAEQLVAISRALGPIATYALLGIALVAVIRLFVEFLPELLFRAVGIVQTIPASLVAKMVDVDPRYEQPIFKKTLTAMMTMLLPLASLVLLAWLWYALWSPADAIQRDLPPPARPSAADGRDFLAWLADRRAQASTGAVPKRRFPIFVVAAQGGGIYATSSSMKLLTAIQAACPAFSDHVYAVSAVSGGALGAVAFASLTVDRKNTDRGCAALTGRTDVFAPVVDRIATEDHLSPVLASTMTDWVAKILLASSWVDSGGTPSRAASERTLWDEVSDAASITLPTKRSDALTASFAASYRAALEVSGPVSITRTFAQFWKDAPRAPYLLLNATAAETGHRIAFSPLSLRGIGDGTVDAAHDLDGRLKLSPASNQTLDGMTLIGAATTSARFPFILPSLAIHHDREAPEKKALFRRRINLVDGGYFDPSGAATAFDLLDNLAKVIEFNGLQDDVSLHLILLTDSSNVADLAVSDGLRGVDIGVPVQALLKSREMLARRAALRAINELPARSIEVIQIELAQDIVPLPLGWLLSRTSHQIIAAMMGRPEACQQTPRDDDANTELRTFSPSRFQSLVRRNSCAQRAIITPISSYLR